MKPQSRQGQARGFTLVEMLVAMALLSITLITIFTVFRTFSTSVDQARERIHTAETRHPGLTAMIADLDQLFVLPYPRYRRPQNPDDADLYRMEGSETRIKGQTFSQLSFTCVNPAPVDAVPNTGVARITYYVHLHGQRLDLHRADRSWPFDLPLSPCSDPVLIRGISDFSLTYTTGSQTETAIWNSDEKSFGYAYPERIHIAVGFGEESENRTLQTAVALPVHREAVQ